MVNECNTYWDEQWKRTTYRGRDIWPNGDEMNRRDVPLCICYDRDSLLSTFIPTSNSQSWRSLMAAECQETNAAVIPLTCQCVWQMFDTPHLRLTDKQDDYFLLLSEKSELNMVLTGKGWKTVISRCCQVFRLVCRLWKVRWVCRRSTVPCCMREPTPNQKLLRRVKLFSTTSEPGLHGWASYHSYGLNL